MSNVLNSDHIDINIKDEKIRIKPLKIKHLARVLKHVSLLVSLFSKKSPNWVNILAQNSGAILDLLESGSDMPREWVEELVTSEAVDILKAVVEVNLDDFLEKVKPQLESFTEKVTEKMKVEV